MLTDTGNSKKEIRIRLATAVTALVNLEKIWRSGEIDFKLKYRLYNSLFFQLCCMAVKAGLYCKNLRRR